jgi:AraC family transcriptional regulator
MKHVLKKHEISGFTLFETLYPPSLKQPRHAHASASFSFVLAGSYLENYGRRTHMRRSSTIILHPPQESHAVDFQSEVRILSVQVDSKRLAYIRDHAAVLDFRASCRTETIAWLGRRIHQEFLRMDNVSGLAMEGLVYEIMAEVSRSKVAASKGKFPRWLDKATDFVNDNFFESFALDDVAKIAGVHPVHLARVFREKHGCTIGEYLRHLRVEFACRQISTTDTLLGEIALAAGFADQSHLTKTFKAYFGLNPSEYRKLFRKG